MTDDPGQAVRETSESQPVPKPTSERTNDGKILFDFTADIIDKQYRCYTWNDGKMQALVATDGALLAGIILIFQTFENISLETSIFLFLAFTFLLISLVVCLVHMIPRLDSGIGNEANLRTMIGIRRFSKEQYHEQVGGVGINDMIRMNCWQIAGMCQNNMRSYRLLQKGVRLTIAGVLVLGFALPFLVTREQQARERERQEEGHAITRPTDVAPPSQASPVPEDVLDPTRQQVPPVKNTDVQTESTRKPAGTTKSAEKEKR